MSRLESFIRRLEAQRACLDWATAPGTLPPGPVFELGLGNGRTYDHLRQRLPGRDIYVFDRQMAAHPDCRPPAEFFVAGELVATLAEAARRFAGRVALVHADLGSGDAARDAALMRALAADLARCLAPGGVLLADQRPDIAGLAEIDRPAGVAPGRYFLYRKAEAPAAKVAPAPMAAGAAPGRNP
jgi:SAM-dependent methyltransferase